MAIELTILFDKPDIASLMSLLTPLRQFSVPVSVSWYRQRQCSCHHQDVEESKEIEKLQTEEWRGDKGILWNLFIGVITFLSAQERCDFENSCY